MKLIMVLMARVGVVIEAIRKNLVDLFELHFGPGRLLGNDATSYQRMSMQKIKTLLAENKGVMVLMGEECIDKVSYGDKVR
jgi:hypothetical protein